MKRVLQVIDAHCGGEPARVVVGGLPRVPGRTMLEKRAYFMEELDDLRQLLLHEPRGYPCQNANFLVEPTSRDAALGVIIAEQGAVYPAMSGHNLMCVAKIAVDTGLAAGSFVVDTPAGPVGVTADKGSVRLDNVASFCKDMDIVVDVPTVGRVSMDVAFGGMWYAVVDAASVGLELTPSRGRDIARLGEMIKAAARQQHPVQHPDYDYPGPDILVFREPARPDGAALRARNAVVMTTKPLDWDNPHTWTAMLDRSPCGTGTCAVMAHLHARGQLAIGQDFIHESIIGSTFRGRLHDTCRLTDGTHAVKPSIEGSAFVTQHATVVLDAMDPFPTGIPQVADIW